MQSRKLPNVLMFGWEFPPYNSGGLGVACSGLTKALSASGLPLTFALPIKVPIKSRWCDFVFAEDFGDILNQKEMEMYMNGYQSVSKEKDNIFRLGNTKVGGSLYEKVLSYGRAARGIARETKHDVIHAHDWLCYPAGIEAKKVSGKPLVVHVHATEFDRSGSDSVNSAIFDIEKRGMDKADMIMAVSNWTKKKVVDKYGINPNKVFVVYNGVEFEEVEAGISDTLEVLKAQGNKIVLFTGRITLQKGPDYFIAMAERVLSREPKTFFVVSGSGDMEGFMMNEVARRGMADKFIFCGFLRGDELSRIYKAADIFVMPSVSEPFGIVPLEAMLSNTPVLVSKESGVSEIISVALKSHFWDIDDMADKVLSVLKHSNLKNHLSINGKKEAKTIHWKKAADSCISLYNSLI